MFDWWQEKSRRVEYCRREEKQSTVFFFFFGSSAMTAGPRRGCLAKCTHLGNCNSQHQQPIPLYTSTHQDFSIYVTPPLTRVRSKLVIICPFGLVYIHLLTNFITPNHWPCALACDLLVV